MKNNILIAKKKFDNERFYLFGANNINMKNIYVTTYNEDFKNYYNLIFDYYNQKESCIKLSKLTPRAEKYRKELLLKYYK
jgi:hypothetical protein